MDEDPAGAEFSLHATAVVIGEAGVLISGPSGAGKSALALALMALAGRGLFVRLVGDDRVRVCVNNGRVLVRPHPVLAGRIEQRGEGVLSVLHEPAAVARLAVELCPSDRRRDIPPRMPGDEQQAILIGGVALPRLMLPKDVSPEQGARRIHSFLRRQ